MIKIGFTYTSPSGKKYTAARMETAVAKAIRREGKLIEKGAFYKIYNWQNKKVKISTLWHPYTQVSILEDEEGVK